MSPIRLTPGQAAQFQRPRLPGGASLADAPPPPGRAPCHPIKADAPRVPTVLLSVTVTPRGNPLLGPTTWEIVARYNDGSVTTAVESQAEAERIKTEIEREGKA